MFDDAMPRRASRKPARTLTSIAESQRFSSVSSIDARWKFAAECTRKSSEPSPAIASRTTRRQSSGRLRLPSITFARRPEAPIRSAAPSAWDREDR